MAFPYGRYKLNRYLRHGLMPQLAAFYAVVQLGSVTRAADALCVAQPTLSGHLRKLSEALGVQLFETAGKRLVPTEAALVLVETAEQMFAALERCEMQLAGLREPARDRVGSGSVESATRTAAAAPLRLPSLLTGAAPQITVSGAARESFGAP